MWSYKWDWIRGIQYDSKSKHSKRRQTVNWTWEVACWFSFSLPFLFHILSFPFFENLGSYVYDSMGARAYGFVFERHQRSDFFVEKLYGMRAPPCYRKCMLAGHARGAARDGLAALGVLGGSAAKWTNVVWPVKSRPTNQQTYKQTHTTLL